MSLQPAGWDFPVELFEPSMLFQLVLQLSKAEVMNLQPTEDLLTAREERSCIMSLSFLLAESKCCITSSLH